jgi:hypothetical protein
MRRVNDNGSMVTRRSLARILAAAAVAQSTESAQTSAPSNTDLESARELLRTNLALIAKVKLPMAIEPACHFKA